MSAAGAALLLGLLSAVTLAAANLFVKLRGDVLVSRMVLSCSAAVLVAPAALLVPLPDRSTLTGLALALPAHFLYQLCLVQALQRGDLSLVFPVMRGCAPILTALGATILIGERLEPLEWAGLAVAAAALLFFAWPPAGHALRSHPDRAALAWATAAAVGIGLYNVADASGVRAAPHPFTFIVWLFLLDWIMITVAALVLRRSSLLRSAKAVALPGLAAGALSIVSFGAALYAFSLTEVAKVSAIRETSIVFAALLGSLFLAERFGLRRLAASVILVGGLIVMQIGSPS